MVMLRAYQRLPFRLIGCTLVVCSFLWLLLVPVIVSAESAISQGFNAAGAITDGALVSVKKDKSATVEVATRQTADRLAGVASTHSLLALSEGARQIQIVIGGTATVLVSDINGPLEAGDKIAVSPIDGVGMKATANGQVVGVAQADFADITTEPRTITDAAGASHTVRIGRLPVRVGVHYYVAPTSNVLPPFIQNLSNTIAGKPVSLARILVATGLTVVGIASVIVLLYSSTRSGITSIGRNPLAASAIRRGLLQVGVYSLIILVFSLTASYLMLKI